MPVNYIVLRRFAVAATRNAVLFVSPEERSIWAFVSSLLWSRGNLLWSGREQKPGRLFRHVYPFASSEYDEIDMMFM